MSIFRITAYIKRNYPKLLKDKDFIENFLEYLNLLISGYEGANDWTELSAHTTFEDLDGPRMSWHKYGFKSFLDIILVNKNILFLIFDARRRRRRVRALSLRTQHLISR